MMKANDVKVAVALIIQGYLRANGEETPNLQDCILAIEQECDDWKENLEPVVGPVDSVTVTDDQD